MAGLNTFFLLALISFSSVLALATETTTPTTTTTNEESDEDLSFLEDPKPDTDIPYYADPNYRPSEDELAGFEEFQAWDKRQPPPLPPPSIEEKDVVVLNKLNFDEFIKKTKYAMVEFYAPWCGYCKQLAPEYAAAATELKESGSEIVLAKVDAIKETELADNYRIDGFPTLFFFSDGVHRLYEGANSREGIVSWLKKKTGDAVYNVTTTKEAEDILLAEPMLVVAYVDSLMGTDSEVLDAVAKQEDDVNFYQTTSPEVAKIFQFDSDVKRPALVLLKKEVEKLSKFDGNFSKSDIVEFVTSNKLPLIITFTMESSTFILEGPIQKQVFLFTPYEQSEKLIPSLHETAKAYKGKIIFSYVNMDNEEYGKPVMDFFGVTGDAPRVLAYTGNDRRKFFMEREITSDNVKSFVEDFLGDKLKPFYKSDALPNQTYGDVKIVVGKTFDEVVLDDSKDVLLEVYAPWCSHCKELEPTYNRLAKHLKSVDSLVIAKMDGTKNEHSRAPVQGFPTILFYPAGKKASDPIVYNAEPKGPALYKFLKKHATTPFKIQKPEPPTSEVDEPSTIETVTPTEAPVSSHGAKDEL